jgi:hypothetical protein
MEPAPRRRQRAVAVDLDAHRGAHQAVRGELPDERLGRGAQAERDRLHELERRLERQGGLELRRHGAPGDRMRVEATGEPVQQLAVTAEPGVHVGRGEVGERSECGEAHPAQQAHQVGVVERLDRQVSEERGRLPRPHHQAVLGEGPAGGLLSGEQPVGDSEADVPDAQRDQPLRDDRPCLDLAPVEPGRHPQRAQARTERGHSRTELFDGDQDLLEGASVSIGPMIGERELGAP